MRRLFARLFWWSWVVTLPLSVVFFVWSSRTLLRFEALGLRTLAGFDLWWLGQLEFEKLPRAAAAATVRAPTGPQAPALFELLVPEADLAALDSDLPGSGQQYVAGALRLDGKLVPADLRYRGDSNYHWGYAKKSWRIRLRGNHSYRGLRSLNLVAPRTPELLNNLLSYRLASLLDLPTPISDVVNATCNGRWLGIYALVEQPREETLQRHGLQRSELYSGDLVMLSFWRGIDNALFDHPGLWEKVLPDPPRAGSDDAPLRRLLELLHVPSSPAMQRELGRVLDLDAFARFHVLELLTESVHVDSAHNWRLCWVPARSAFVPLVWDLMGWHSNMRADPAGEVRADVVTSALHVALLHNSAFLVARQRALDRFFGSGHDRVFLQQMDELRQRIDASIDKDANLDFDLRNHSPAAARAAWAQLRTHVDSVFARLRQTYEAAGEIRFAPLAEDRIGLHVEGRRPVVALTLQLDRAPAAPVPVRVHYRVGDQPELLEVAAARWNGAAIEFDCALVADHVPEVVTLGGTGLTSNRVRLAPGYYEIECPGAVIRGVTADRGQGKLPVAAGVAEPRSFHQGFALLPAAAK